MTLLEDVEKHFATNNLYEVLNISKGSTSDQIKKAYRKASLKIHPDRVGDDLKDEATKRFQVLAQVHYVLSDSDRKKLYDDHGIIANEDGLDSEADWADYWRILFPKIKQNDITNFLDNYIGSADEEQDLIAIYNRYEGDMDKICQTHISYDEAKTTEDLNKLIEEGKLTKFEKFCNEPRSKKEKRKKRAEKEAKQAERAKKKLSSEDNMNDLAALIHSKSKNNFDSMIANLEAKYSKKSGGVKRKRGDR